MALSDLSKTQSPSPSLRSRLLLGLGFTFTVTALILAVGVWAYAQRAADLSYDRLLTGAALSMLDGVQVIEGQIEVDLPNSSLEMLSMAPNDRVFYRVQGTQGELLTGYGDLPVIELSDQYANKPRFFDSRYKGALVRFAVVSKPFSEPGLTGRAFVTVGHTRLAREELAREILLGAVGILVLTVLVALGGLGAAINRSFAPLNDLKESLAARAASDLTPIQSQGPKEVEPLVSSINGFMLRLKDSMDALQMFIARAAHQIRTPLSNMQAQLELSKKDQGEEALRVRLNRLSDQHERLTRLTNQLLSHALVVHRADTGKLEKLCLTELVQQVLTDAVRDHADSLLEFGLDEQASEVWINGDWLSLREALQNLIDNAIKYGPKDNIIMLRLHREIDGVSVSVSDNGPGIPPLQQPNLLGRFERKQVGNETGTGLGLAIVQDVVHALGGRVTMQNLANTDTASKEPEHLTGLRITLWLPCLPEMPT